MSGRQLTARDRRLTWESEVLSVVSAHGGERIIAGPPMDRMVREIVDLIEARDDLYARPTPADDLATVVRDVSGLADWPADAWERVRGGDPIARAINAATDVIQDRCPVCGGAAFRPDPVTTRREAKRCVGCGHVVGWCSCANVKPEAGKVERCGPHHEAMPCNRWPCAFPIKPRVKPEAGK